MLRPIFGRHLDKTVTRWSGRGAIVHGAITRKAVYLPQKITQICGHQCFDFGCYLPPSFPRSITEIEEPFTT